MDSVIRLSGNEDIKFSEFYALIEIPLKVAFYEAFWHIWEQENQLQKDFFVLIYGVVSKDRLTSSPGLFPFF